VPLDEQQRGVELAEELFFDLRVRGRGRRGIGAAWAGQAPKGEQGEKDQSGRPYCWHGGISGVW
jgi:hypothetical protein